ncbi:MAG: Smr/MutS family protein [Gammaproteobacteria bacterium]|nr:Smr/MutS family protein [Gammaproteobacteria bacterium]
MSNEDDELFRRTMADAKPIKSETRVEPPRRRPKPKAHFSRADEGRVLDESMRGDLDEMEQFSGEALRFHRPTVGRRTMRKLARGNYAVQAEIDLHGMTVLEAKPRLAEFIEECARSGHRCVRVVHGKGLGSGQRGPVLKASVNRWLRRWDHVLAFVSTRQVDGGTGAVYVLLQDL